MADSYITRKTDRGTVNISEDVVASIVKAAVTETEGVAELANAAGADIAEFIGIKTNAKGIKIRFDGEKIIVDVIITVEYGCNIVKVASDAQQAILTAVEGMTGFDGAEVNVHVAGIAF